VQRVNIESIRTAQLSDVFTYQLISIVQFCVFQGATILDQCVCIQSWGTYTDESDPWNSSSWMPEDDTSSTVCIVPSAGCRSWLLGSLHKLYFT
jgi:hypothetical protein